MTCYFALNLEEICQTDFMCRELVHGIVQEMVELLRKRPQPLYTAGNWPD